MAKVFRVVSSEIIEERLLPAFERLAGDNIWGVRKACAESLADISNECNSMQQLKFLVRIQQALQSDTSKWVRASAQQRLGYFITSAKAAEMVEVCLEAYISIFNQDKSRDSQLYATNPEALDDSQRLDSAQLDPLTTTDKNRRMAKRIYVSGCPRYGGVITVG